MRRRPPWLAAVLAPLPLVVACAPVPDIYFVADDAGADAADAGFPEVGAPDAGDAEPGTDGGCAGAGPSGGVCCGTIWCVGECDTVGCATCTLRLAQGSMCATSDLCCVKNGNAVCRASCP